MRRIFLPCAHCGLNNVTMTPQFAWMSFEGKSHHELTAALTCNSCGLITTGRSWITAADASEAGMEYRQPIADPASLILDQGLRWEWCPRLAAPTPVGLPGKVDRAACEARRAEAAMLPLAAIVMARAAIEAAAKAHGVVDGMLGQKISALEQQGILTQELAARARAIRDVGNDGAHADIADCSFEDMESEVADTLALMDLILDSLYGDPDGPHRRQTERNANRSALKRSG